MHTANMRTITERINGTLRIQKTHKKVMSVECIFASGLAQHIEMIHYPTMVVVLQKNLLMQKTNFVHRCEASAACAHTHQGARLRRKWVCCYFLNFSVEKSCCKVSKCSGRQKQWCYNQEINLLWTAGSWYDTCSLVTVSRRVITVLSL